MQPFASLIEEVPLDCPRALLNLERVGENRGGSLFARFGPSFGEGFDFDSEHTRDIFCGGPVDDTVRLIARECGWEEELDEMHKQMHSDMDRQQGSANKSQTKKKNSASSESVSAPASNDLTDSLADQLQSASLQDKGETREKL